MADKKEQLSYDERELLRYRLDLDSLDDDLGIGRQPDDKKRGPIREFTSGVKRGFLNQARSRLTLTRLLRSALPAGYNRALSGAETLKRDLKNVGSDLGRQHHNELLSLVQKAESNLAAVKDRTPEKIYKEMERQVKRQRKKLEEYQSSNASPMSQREMDRSEMQGGLDETFLLKQGQAQEAGAERRFERERVERTMTAQLEGARFDLSQRELSGINRSVSRLADYNDQINYRFQRKQLELQYRNYFVLRDMRRYMETQSKIQETGFSSLVHNSGLPDYLKLTQADRARRGVRQGVGGILGTMGTGIGTSMGGYLANYYPQLFENLKASGGRAIQNLGMAGAAGGALGNLGGMGGAGALGDVLGSLLGDRARDFIVPQLGRLARPMLDRFSHRNGALDKRLSYGMDNLPSILQSYTQDMNQSQGFRGFLQSAARGIFPQFMRNDTLTEGGFQSIDRPSAFTHLTQRTLVEAIPGYLARVLQELRMVRTGRDDIELETYDITNGRFTGYRDAGRNLVNRMLPKVDRQMTELQLDDAMTEYDPEGRLSADAKKALRLRLLEDATNNGRFSAQRYSQSETYRNASEDVQDELSGHFRQRFSFDVDGKMVNNGDNHALQQRLSKELLRVRGVAPDVQGAIRRQFGTGAQSLLRDLGLVVNENGRDRINQNRINELLLDSQQDATGGFQGGTSAGFNQGGQPPGGFPPPAPYNAPPIPPDIVPHSAPTTAPQPSGEYRQYLDDIKNLQLDGQRQKEDFYEALFNRLDEGFDIRSMPPILVAGNMEGQIDQVDPPNEDATPAKRSMWRRLLGGGRKLGRGLGRYYSWLGRTMGRGAMGGARGVAGLFKRGGGDSSKRFEDIYLKGQKEPIILARDLKAGVLTDEGSGDVIRKVDDITGPVVDQDGNYVLTQQDFDTGLYNRRGDSVLKKAASGLWSFYQNTYLRPGAAAIRTLPKMARFARDVLTPSRDLYVAGEDTPRLLARLISRGEYLNEDNGKPIRRHTDITGNVIDQSGNVVLTREELPRLVYRNGDPVETAGQRLGRRLRSVAGLPFNLARKVGRGVGSLYRGMGRMAGGLFGRRKGRSGGRQGDDPESTLWQQNMLEVVGDIHAMLNERLPDNGKPRRNSWQDILARREAEKAQVNGNDPAQNKNGKGFLGGLAGGLMSLLRGRQDDEEEEDGDTTIISGGDSSGSNKKKKKKVPKGFWNKVRHFGGKGARGLGTVLKGGLSLVGLGGLTGLGGTAMVGLGAVGSGLAAGATAIGGILSAPVVIGAAVTAGLAYGGYKLYQHYKRAGAHLAQLRMAQYGVHPDNSQQGEKIAGLEQLFKKAVGFDDNQPTLDARQINYEELMQVLELDPESSGDIERLGVWIGQRFKPVYLAWQKALKQLAPQVALESVDSDLPKDQGRSLLNIVRFRAGGNTPYGVTVSPFGETDTLDATSELIQELWQKAWDDYKGAETKPTVVSEVPKDDKVKGLGQAALTNNPARLPGGGGMTYEALEGARLVTGQQRQRSRYATQRGILPFDGPNSERLTALETVRMRAYGLGSLTRHWVNALFTLETAALKNVQVDSSGEASWSSDPQTFFRDYGSLFGISASDEVGRQRFYTWFEARFVPVLIAYASAVRRFQRSIEWSQVEFRLSRTQQMSTAKAVLAATGKYRREDISIWDVPASIFGEDAETQGDYKARKVVDYLGELANKEHYQSEVVDPTGKLDNAKIDFDKTPSIFKSTVEQARKNALRPKATGMDRALTFSTSLNNPNGSTATGQKGLAGGVPYLSGQTAGARGNTVTTLTKGNGGAWEDIPLPKKDGSREAAMPTLMAVGEMTGVDPELLATFCSIESGFRASVKASTSSATGWFQFISKTWDWMIGKYGAKYGIPSNANPRDPRINALMGAEFLKSNARSLEGIGRPVTDTDLYLAHFLGAGTAKKFLNMDQNAIGSRNFSEQAGANGAIFFKPAGQPRTIGEIYALLDEKVATHRRGGGSAVSTRTAANDEPVGNHNATISDDVMADMGGSATAAMAVASRRNRQAIDPTNPMAMINTPITAAGGASAQQKVSSQSAGGMDATAAGFSAILTPKQILDRETQQQERAKAVDQSRQETTQATMEKARSQAEVSQRQLEVQMEMRDLLSSINERFKLTSPSSGGSTAAANEPSTNQSTQERARYRSGNTTPPINVSR